MNSINAIHEEIAEERRELKINVFLTAVTFVGLAFGIVLQIADASVWYWGSAFFIAYLAGGIPASIEAFKTLLEKSLDINLLMILAALAAAGVGEARDGAILLFLFSLAGTLEGYAMGSTKRAVAALMSLRPDEATIKNSDGTTKRVGVEDLVVGDVVVVRPGERMPADGEVIEGDGAVDQSPITGESVPVDKAPGDQVFAGSVNQHAVMLVRVTTTASHSTLARMIELVTQAHAKRSPSERFSDWFGQRYTIVVLVGSVLALIGFIAFGLPYADAFYKAATLLVVASPCAIVISVPAAILSALTVSARGGALFKGGAAMEVFGRTKIVAFDKTGTLTVGAMTVTTVETFSNDPAQVLAVAYALESHSEHPLAQSICEYAESNNITPLTITGTKALPGKGIVGKKDGQVLWAGNRRLAGEQGVVLDDVHETALIALEESGQTTILIGRGSVLLGAIALADTLRRTAIDTLERLRTAGVERVVMLSGDTQVVANAIGEKLGLSSEDIYGGLLPEDKVRIVEELKLSGTVAFVGDGVNDAAALVTADVGIAMGAAGTDVAIEAADVALLSHDLTHVVRAHKIADHANRIIRQNLTFAIGIMLLMVVTTIFWHLPLPLGVIGHEGGTLLVVANGLRLLWQYRV
ncbi:MAG: heavy metal translocating P-type ATPase [Candidatus Paceibacteria bacterium]